MSYRTIIADDEPLVLIGLNDMIDWASEGFEIVGQARNGKVLEEEIEKHDPDLVISDIKMPVETGIEVLERIRAKGKSLPLFIFLTSFEEFDLIKKAMNLEALDYIVKLELDKTQLLEALKKARDKIRAIKGANDEDDLAFNEKQLLQERYFMRQLFSIDVHDLDAKALDIDLDADAFAVSYISFSDLLTQNGGLSRFYSAYRLIEETVNRYTKCYLIQLDYGHIAAIFPFSEKQRAGYRSYISTAFKAAALSIKDYFSLSVKISTGPLVGSIDLLSDSFFKAKLLFTSREGGKDEMLFFDYSENKDLNVSAPDFDTLGFTKAFGELNAELLKENIDKVIDSLKAPTVTKIHAMEIASSILYMAITLVPDAEKCLEEIFPEEENIFSYRQLYQAVSTMDIIKWLERLCSGFSSIFNERRQDYRLQTIQKVQAYIRENVDKRLTLKDVASVFGYSQNYLSSLFGKYAGLSFIDYVNKCKIEKAKNMLSNPNTMIYEVATRLGFDSQFYFSKVFKKIEGISPTAYQNKIKRKEES